LASVQLARGFVPNNELWGTVATALKDQQIRGSKWYKKVAIALTERNLKSEVWDTPSEVLVQRKAFGVKFSQFCFHQHLNLLTGTSADKIREVQPFGIYPFLLQNPLGLSRFLLAFILSNWRWLDRGKCLRYPRDCDACRTYNNLYHLLFECTRFTEERLSFFNITGVPLDFECLKVDERELTREAAIVGKTIYFKMCDVCGN
jgi:hypothetical protein